MKNYIDSRGFWSELDTTTSRRGESETASSLVIKCSSIQISGSIVGDKKVTLEVTSDYTMSLANTFLFVDASSGSVSVSLPSIQNDDGFGVTIKKIDNTANLVNILPTSGQTIDLETSVQITESMVSLTIISNGGNWWVV